MGGCDFVGKLAAQHSRQWSSSFSFESAFGWCVFVRAALNTSRIGFPDLPIWCRSAHGMPERLVLALERSVLGQSCSNQLFRVTSLETRRPDTASRCSLGSIDGSSFLFVQD